MPSILVHNGSDGPIAKRQKLANSVASGRPGQESRIFRPFRVSMWPSAVCKEVFAKACEDNWSSLSYESSFHVNTAGKNFFPDHDLGRKMPANLRPQARLELGLPHKATDPRKCYGCAGMEGQSVCCMVRRISGISARAVGIQKREEGRGAGCSGGLG